MRITIDLPVPLETELSAEAMRLGLSLSDYVVHVLTTERAGLQRPKTGAELVAYWQAEGLIGTRPASTDSAALARDIRRRAEQRMQD